jgi:hypothetical protein
MDHKVLPNCCWFARSTLLFQRQPSMQQVHDALKQYLRDLVSDRRSVFTRQAGNWRVVAGLWD